ncbi:MAG: hypothetical protein Q4Q62_00480 [Thermoplasmata archaeon]|nr:hypothetical protein [Thermoplasmata archaeon]
MSDDSYGRPILVTLIGILYLLIGIVVILGAVGLSYVSIDTLIDHGLDRTVADLLSSFGIGVAVLGVIYVILAIGFFRGWSVMWYLGVLFTVLGIIGSLSLLLMTGGISVIGLIVEVAIMWYLFRRNVKQFFLGHE